MCSGSSIDLSIPGQSREGDSKYNLFTYRKYAQFSINMHYLAHMKPIKLIPECLMSLLM